MPKLGKPGGDLVQFGVSQAWLCSRSFSNGLLGTWTTNRSSQMPSSAARSLISSIPLAHLLHIEMAGVRIGFEQPIIGMVGLLAGLGDDPI